jgi:hypothetical protein
MVSPLLRPLDKSVKEARSAVDSIFAIEKKLRDGKEPVHSYENAKDKLISCE